MVATVIQGNKVQITFRLYMTVHINKLYILHIQVNVRALK